MEVLRLFLRHLFLLRFWTRNRSLHGNFWWVIVRRITLVKMWLYILIQRLYLESWIFFFRFHSPAFQIDRRQFSFCCTSHVLKWIIICFLRYGPGNEALPRKVWKITRVSISFHCRGCNLILSRHFRVLLSAWQAFKFIEKSMQVLMSLHNSFFIAILLGIKPTASSRGGLIWRDLLELLSNFLVILNWIFCAFGFNTRWSNFFWKIIFVIYTVENGPFWSKSSFAIIFFQNTISANLQG